MERFGIIHSDTLFQDSFLLTRSYVGGWGGESNREIVSFRACVRARGGMPSEIKAKFSGLRFSLFCVFALGESSLFPCGYK